MLFHSKGTSGTTEAERREAGKWARVAGALAGAPQSFTLLGHSPLGWGCPPAGRPPPSFAASAILTTDSRGVEATGGVVSGLLRASAPSLWFAAYTPYSGLGGMTVGSKELIAECVRSIIASECRSLRASKHFMGGEGSGNQSPRRGNAGTPTSPKSLDRDAKLEAYQIAKGMAGNQKSYAIRFLGWVLSHCFKWFFAGEIYVDQKGIGAIRELQKTHTLVYVPTHKSHVDYLMLSYVLFASGLMCPNIAAGDNLDIPLIGDLMRGCGAFFIRRSNHGVDGALYKKVLAGYIEALLIHGHMIEFFIEGGRSRDGHIGRPKLGLLTYVVDAFLDGDLPRNGNVAIVPLTISYDRPIEEASMIKENLGKPKEPESLWRLTKAICNWLLMSFSRSSSRPGDGGCCGCSTVSFGQPIDLKTFFKARSRGLPVQHASKSRVLTHISEANGNNRRKSLERGQNEDHDPLVSAFPKSSEERRNAITTLGMAIHTQLRKCNVVSSHGLVLCGMLLESFATATSDFDRSGWISLEKVSKSAQWLEAEINKHGGKCMSVKGDGDIERVSTKVLAVAEKLEGLVEISSGDERGDDEENLHFRIIRTPETLLGVYYRNVQVLASLAPRALVSCAVMAASRGFAASFLCKEGTLLSRTLTTGEFAQKTDVLEAAAWLRCILAGELDIIIGESAYRLPSAFAAILDDMIAKGELVQWEPPTKSDSNIYAPSNGSGGSVSNLCTTSEGGNRDSVEQVVDLLIGEIVVDIGRKSMPSASLEDAAIRRQRKMAVEKEMGKASNRNSLAYMEGVGRTGTGLLEDSLSIGAPLKVLKEIKRSSCDSDGAISNSSMRSVEDLEPVVGVPGDARCPARFYSFLLSPLLSTYHMAFANLREIYADMMEDDIQMQEKMLIQIIHENLAECWNRGDGFEGSRCVVPAHSVIKRFVDSLKRGPPQTEERRDELPLPMLVRTMSSFYIMKGAPPCPGESSFPTVRRNLSDTSVSTDVGEDLPKVTGNGGLSGGLSKSTNPGPGSAPTLATLGNTSNPPPAAYPEYLRLRRELQDPIAFANFVYRVQMFLPN
ncbi:hypothetical protein BSKO_11884 [Bryopsis sp. KO-2023]|nr:hypothetical protein BSKO_11884 [Bryopsis sp. KO-2023]